MALTFRECFLEGAAEASVGDLHHAALATAVLGRSVKAIDSPHLLNGEYITQYNTIFSVQKAFPFTPFDP